MGLICLCIGYLVDELVYIVVIEVFGMLCGNCEFIWDYFNVEWMSKMFGKSYSCFVYCFGYWVEFELFCYGL